jgi:MFS family permease
MLGLVSLFMDVSSEMIHSLLPVFVVSVLGASATTLGLLEGFAEGTVSLVKILSGAVSDWLRRRKVLALLGYGIAALTKPLFPVANSFGLVVTARLIDRVGKGIREAPRDALIADLTSENVRGASYGLRQSLDTFGAIAGPLSAMGLMVLFKGEFRRVFWIAVLPAFISVGLLASCVHETRIPAPRRARFDRRNLRHFPRTFWFIAVTGGVFTLARFSEAFLIIRASSLGMNSDYVPLVLIVMNIAYATSAWPAGHMSDRVDRRFVLSVSGILLVAADLVLAIAAGIPTFLLGVALWGLHMGFSQGILAALVADAAPAERRGIAFGMFSLITGVALLAASLMAGQLWDHFGPPATFLAGATFASIGLIALLLQTKMQRPSGSPGDGG